MKKATHSKILVLVCIGLIILGTLGWNVWDRLGTEGLDPKRIKSMASDYEHDCYLRHREQCPEKEECPRIDRRAARYCKKHIGRNHRSCLKKSIIRSSSAEIQYNEQGYRQCLSALESSSW